jgi:hypothetical protein
MSSRLTLYLVSAVVAASAATLATADDRDHRDNRQPEARQQHSQRSDFRSRGGDRRDPRVGSRQSLRSQYRASPMPPALRHEVRGSRPSNRHSWISGYWGWRPGFRDWFWYDGYWALPPYEGHVYVQPRCLHKDGRSSSLGRAAALAQANAEAEAAEAELNSLER